MEAIQSFVRVSKSNWHAEIIAVFSGAVAIEGMYNFFGGPKSDEFCERNVTKNGFDSSLLRPNLEWRNKLWAPN